MFNAIVLVGGVKWTVARWVSLKVNGRCREGARTERVLMLSSRRRGNSFTACESAHIHRSGTLTSTRYSD
jgi:hypothetical protein